MKVLKIGKGFKLFTLYLDSLGQSLLEKLSWLRTVAH